MRATCQQGLVLGLVGLPRSGTTIVCNAINSADNGFCLSEPHNWLLEFPHAAGTLLDFGKVAMRCGAPEAVMPAVRAAVAARGDAFGGVKETFGPRKAALVAASADLTVLVYRDPVATYGSWKRTGWDGFGDVEKFVADHAHLAAWHRLSDARLLRYEDFCFDPLGALNQACGPELLFEGDLAPAPMKSALGDSDGLSATAVRPPRADGADGADGVTDEERATITACCDLTRPALNLGCGCRPLPGAVNHDRRMHSPHVDVAYDLDALPWPFPDGAFGVAVAQDVVEHLRLDVEQWLDEAWRILSPGGTLCLRVPHWQSRNAWADPTHRRAFAPETFNFWDKSTEQWRTRGRYYFDSGRWWRVLRSVERGGNVEFVLMKDTAPDDAAGGHAER